MGRVLYDGVVRRLGHRDDARRIVGRVESLRTKTGTFFRKIKLYIKSQLDQIEDQQSWIFLNDRCNPKLLFPVTFNPSFRNFLPLFLTIRLNLKWRLHKSTQWFGRKKCGLLKCANSLEAYIFVGMLTSAWWHLLRYEAVVMG